MINAILLIFFGMTTAEQGVVTGLACAVPEPIPVDTVFSIRNGVTKTYADGSSLTIDGYSTLVLDSQGNQVYFVGE